MDKELDLQKFIHRQRVFTTAILGLLSRTQSKFVDKMSQLVIRESSNFEETSSDQELLSDLLNQDENYTAKMIKSVDKVDKRLVNLYRVRKAEQHGIPNVGFKLTDKKD